MDNNRIELVLVHLGKTFPKSVVANLEFIRFQFPDQKMTMIIDSHLNGEYLRRRGINFRFYKDVTGIDAYLSKHSYSADFRDGFWQLSTKRVFAFLEYCQEEDNNPKLHIENDIHLFQNFPFSAFESLPKPAWLSYNDQRDVGSIISCPNKIMAKWLIEKILAELREDPNFTDMTLLKEVSTAYPDSIIKLPIAEGPDSAFFAQNVTKEDRLRNSEYFQHFSGVFDAAPLGMWITGQDPRNHRGTLLLHTNHADSYIQPNQVSYEWVGGSLITSVQEAIKIFNLHVHSKEVSLLRGSDNVFQSYVKLTSNKKEIHRFKSRVFISLSMKFLTRKIKRLVYEVRF